MSSRSVLMLAVSATLVALGLEMPARSAGGGSTPPPNPAIAFVDSGLKVMNADGTNVRTLVALGRNDSLAAPCWSGDGQQLSFCGVRGGVRGIWKVNLDGTGLQLLAPQAGIVLSSTDWSRGPTPDGRNKIAFRSTGVGGAFDVFVVNTDGTGLQNLTNSAEDEQSPCWTRDCSGIYSGTLGPNFRGRLLQLGAASGGGLTVLTAIDMLTDWYFFDCQVGNAGSLMLFRGGPRSTNTMDAIWCVDQSVLPWTPMPVYPAGMVQRAPSFAPGDSRVALRVNGSGSTSGIFTANPDGSGPVRIRASGTDVAWKRN